MFVFFDEMAGRVWSQKELEERLREIKFIMLMCAGDRCHGSPHRTTREVLGEAFIGVCEGKAREGEQFRTGSFEQFPWALGSGDD